MVVHSSKCFRLDRPLQSHRTKIDHQLSSEFSSAEDVAFTGVVSSEVAAPGGVHDALEHGDRKLVGRPAAIEERHIDGCQTGAMCELVIMMLLNRFLKKYWVSGTHLEKRQSTATLFRGSQSLDHGSLA